MNNYRCDCGDTECPSCGTAQSTYTDEYTAMELKLATANRHIKQLCGTVNTLSNKLGLGNKVRYEDFEVQS